MSNAAPAVASEDSFAALFEESLTRKEMRTGEVITAEVVRVDMNYVVVNAGLKRNNVVVSRRAVLEASQGAERQALLANLQEGAVVKGIVKNITDYGAFVDLGGIDGLLHITDLAWRRVKHPSEVLNVGDEVTAKVLKVDTEKNRVSLGL